MPTNIKEAITAREVKMAISRPELGSEAPVLFSVVKHRSSAVTNLRKGSE